MKLFLILGALAAIAVIIFFITRKKQDQKSVVVSADESQEISQVQNQTLAKEEKIKAHLESSNIIKDLKKTDAIRPEGNQQRNLDRETGGTEAEEQKESSEKDVWDERSEEVDRMGATHQLSGTGKESMIWRKKKEKLDEKKMDKAKNAAESHRGNQKSSGTNFDSRGQQGGFTQLVKARQDHQIDPGGRGF